MRAAQAELARSHGIHGFMYYHYWFGGRRILQRPVDEILASGEPEFPFALCWANENWTRRWDGKDSEVLLPEQYSEADDRNHLDWLATAFADPRYIRVNGKPLFAMYRPLRLPDPCRTTDTWRERAHQLGVGELYLCRVEAHPEERGDPTALGFDAAIEFQPDWVALGEPERQGRGWSYARTFGLVDRLYQRHRIFDYRKLVPRMLAKEPARTAAFRASPPDGTTRRGSRPTRGSSAGRRHASTAAGFAPCWSGSSRSAPARIWCSSMRGTSGRRAPTWSRTGGGVMPIWTLHGAHWSRPT